jgi:hypothetical protein
VEEGFSARPKLRFPARRKPRWARYARVFRQVTSAKPAGGTSRKPTALTLSALDLLDDGTRDSLGDFDHVVPIRAQRLRRSRRAMRSVRSSTPSSAAIPRQYAFSSPRSASLVAPSTAAVAASWSEGDEARPRRRGAPSLRAGGPLDAYANICSGASRRAGAVIIDAKPTDKLGAASQWESGPRRLPCREIGRTARIRRRARPDGRVRLERASRSPPPGSSGRTHRGRKRSWAKTDEAKKLAANDGNGRCWARTSDLRLVEADARENEVVRECTGLHESPCKPIPLRDSRGCSLDQSHHTHSPS